METNYDQQAAEFLTKTGTTFSAKFLRNGKRFSDDKDSRDIYEIELKRGFISYVFTFGQSIVKSEHWKDKLSNRTFSMSGNGIGGNYSISPSALNLFYHTKIKGEVPRPYDVLACLTKYNPGTFEDFCGEFGYDEDSRKAERVYKAVVDEWLKVSAMFSADELQMLQEIN